jgi:site-specific DNA recombinase
MREVGAQHATTMITPHDPTPKSKDAAKKQPVIRCAIYARYSSKLQRSTSIEDQVRNCRRAAEEKGWLVLDEYIRSDSELSGRTVIGRDGFQDLIKLGKQRPLPFDCVLIDDTSRLARYVPDALRECDVFTFYGVFIYFVSDNLDSRDGDNFRLVHLIKSYGDERHSRDLGKKIHRGQEGRILKGYTAGGSSYGYRNHYLRDPSEKGDHGENKVIGVEQQIVPEEAAVVARIMEMRAAGISFADIAKTLKAEGVVAPRRKYKGQVRDYWLPSSIKQITKNELYRGVRVWNRTQKLLNQAEGSKRKRVRPQSEWVRKEVPSLRIISDELWDRVQQVNQHMKDKIYGRRLGGLHRTPASRTYLFSGVLSCGLCHGKFAVIIGGAASKVRYGCKNHRFRATCTNNMTILRSRLEHQLISAIAMNLSDPRLEEERIQEFRKQLEARIALEEQLAAEGVSNRPKLETERLDIQKKARNLADAIAQHGFSQFLSEQLAEAESRLAEIERLLRAKPAAKLPAFTDEQIRGFLRKECHDFCELLKSEPEAARREIQKRIKNLILTPKQTPTGAVLEVSGDIELLRTGDVLDESPLDGTALQYIQPRIVITAVLDRGAGRRADCSQQRWCEAA